MGSPRGQYWAQHFNIFINKLEDGIQCTLTRFANDAKLSEESDSLDRRATLQEDLDRLKSRLTRTIWSSTRSSIRSHTWENRIQECSTCWDLPTCRAALQRGTLGSWWAAGSIWVNSVLLWQRKPKGCQVTSTRASPTQTSPFQPDILWFCGSTVQLHLMCLCNCSGSSFHHQARS